MPAMIPLKVELTTIAASWSLTAGVNHAVRPSKAPSTAPSKIPIRGLDILGSSGLELMNLLLIFARRKLFAIRWPTAIDQADHDSRHTPNNDSGEQQLAERNDCRCTLQPP